MKKTRIYVSYNRQYQADKIKVFVEYLSSAHPEYEFVYHYPDKPYNTKLISTCEGVFFIYPDENCIKNNAKEVVYIIGKGQHDEIEFANKNAKRVSHVLLSRNLDSVSTAFSNSLSIINNTDYRKYAQITINKMLTESTEISLMTLKHIVDTSKNKVSKRENLAPLLEQNEASIWVVSDNKIKLEVPTWKDTKGSEQAVNKTLVNQEKQKTITKSNLLLLIR